MSDAAPEAAPPALTSETFWPEPIGILSQIFEVARVGFQFPPALPSQRASLLTCSNHWESKPRRTLADATSRRYHLARF